MRGSIFLSQATFVLVLWILPLDQVLAQQAIKANSNIFFDAKQGTFSKEMPHGKPFTVESRLPKSFSRAEFHWWLAVEDKCHEKEESKFAVGVLESKLDRNLQRR